MPANTQISNTLSRPGAQCLADTAGTGLDLGAKAALAGVDDDKGVARRHHRSEPRGGVRLVDARL